MDNVAGLIRELWFPKMLLYRIHITGRNSLVNKDYSEQYTSHAFIAGAPAKPVSYHVQRIFSNQMEGDLRRYFEENGTRIVFQGVKGEEEDPYEEIVGMFCYNY